MGSKRKRKIEAEDRPVSTEAPSSYPFRHIRHRPSNSDHTASDSPSINRLKSKIRDTTRLLNRVETIPADVRIEKERALAGYQQDLEGAEEQAEKHKRRQALIKKYHKVRFVERKKATRILKQTQKRLEKAEEGSPEHESLVVDVHNAEVDLNYTLYHPLLEKYHGLYPRDQAGSTPKDEEARAEKSEKEPASKPKYWTVVEQCMQDGTLDALREGKLAQIPSDTKEKPKESTKIRSDGAAAKKTSRKGELKSATRSLPEDENDESDGGFFEE